MKKAVRIVVILVILVAAAMGADKLTRRAPAPVGISGTIVADEVRVGSRYGGRVRKIYAREGDALTAGQVILELEATELTARRAAAAAALAELEKGARPQELDAARAEWKSLNAELDNAQSDLKRVRDKYKQGVLTAEDRDRAAKRVTSLEQAVAAAKSRQDLLTSGTRSERLDQARAALAEIDAQLAETRIVAPADSVLETLAVEEGGLVAPNREIAALVFPDRLSVKVYVPETWLSKVVTGDTAVLSVGSFPGREFAATVRSVSRTAEFTPRNVQTVDEREKQVFAVDLKLAETSGTLRAGMSADVHFKGMPPVRP
ncbi:MAG: efflux RND transporter periplasmic adaptor subunit [Candidatus Sumerlaeaceae bacterium]|nr:efflux RND transporter periplasmic adaptor subunit [Candidatus Sumerlaeaceae bacterium]